jgi:phenylalanyl-tRNA synthetase alpha chain
VLEDLERLLAEARAEIAKVTVGSEAEALRVKYLGKKGAVSALLARLREVAAAERPAFGARANQVKSEIETQIEAIAGRLARAALDLELRREKLDVSLPGRRPTALGHAHPVAETGRVLLEIFSRMGFTAVETPEVELDYYNFEALNQPPDHPARDMQDTFYVDTVPVGDRAPRNPVLLRSHTSPAQIREMLRRQPPVRIVSPGRVYRRDDDPTHSPMFHQIEVLYVDRDVSLGDLKWTLEEIAHGLFGEGFHIRLRPSFFPFVQPGAEVDLTCTICGGKGCRTCKGTGYVEVLGAGMVHPRVLKHVGYDPEQLSGFAFGLGVDRFAMLRHGLTDLRLFFENDVRYLEAF